MSVFHHLDLPVPGLVHVHVSTGTLQQLLLRRPSAGHRHGRENPAHYSVFCYPQWQTGTQADTVILCTKRPQTKLILTTRLSASSQLVMTVGLLAVVVYLYTVVAFNFFRKFYNKSEDEDEPDMKCDDMMTVSGGQRIGWRIHQ